MEGHVVSKNGVHGDVFSVWTLCGYGLRCSAAFFVTCISQKEDKGLKLEAVMVLWREVKTDTFYVPIS